MGPGWARGRGGGGYGFVGNSEHGPFPLSRELEAVALLPGPSGEQMGPGGPPRPDPWPLPLARAARRLASALISGPPVGLSVQPPLALTLLLGPAPPHLPSLPPKPVRYSEPSSCPLGGAYPRLRHRLLPATYNPASWLPPP